MNKDEKIVYDYLRTNGFKSIKPEPDGNIPPDFSINDQIALEVRRLNENYLKDGRVLGFQEENIKLWSFMRSFASNYNNDKLRTSYWLSFDYERPLPKFSELKKLLKNKLDSFINHPTFDEIIEIVPSLRIRLRPNVKGEKCKITIASSHDDNSGGCVLSIYISNIEFCIQEKTEKINQYLDKYSEWWLVLVDSIVYGINEPYEIERIKHTIKLPNVWKKLIIINPKNNKSILTILN